MTEALQGTQDRNLRPQPSASAKRLCEESEEQGSGRSFRREPEAVAGTGAERTLRRAGQAGKSARGMPWHQEPKKDVTSCDKLRGGANIRYIRRFPNGGTQHGNTVLPCVESNRRTGGTA